MREQTEEKYLKKKSGETQTDAEIHLFAHNEFYKTQNWKS